MAATPPATVPSKTSLMKEERMMLVIAPPLMAAGALIPLLGGFGVVWAENGAWAGLIVSFAATCVRFWSQ